MSPKAEAAAQAFYSTLREKGKRVDSARLAQAWENVVKELAK